MRRPHPILAAASTGASDSEPPRARFRRHLRSGAVDLTSLRQMLARGMPQIGIDPEARLAVEEIVSHLGELLGFGCSRDEHAEADLWTSSTGSTMVVRVMSAEDLPAALVPLCQARDRRLADTDVPSHRLSTLAVVCGSRLGWRQVEEAVRVRRALESVRLVSADALVALADLRQRQVLAHVDAVALLRPQSARADALIDLVVRYARFGADAPGTPEPPDAAPL